MRAQRPLPLVPRDTSHSEGHPRSRSPHLQAATRAGCFSWASGTSALPHVLPHGAAPRQRLSPPSCRRRRKAVRRRLALDEAMGKAPPTALWVLGMPGNVVRPRGGCPRSPGEGARGRRCLRLTFSSQFLSIILPSSFSLSVSHPRERVPLRLSTQFSKKLKTNSEFVSKMYLPHGGN